MDLNELLFHHQVALIGEQQDCLMGRPAKRSLVQHYSERLARMRRHLGVPAYAWSSTSTLKECRS